MRRDLANVWTRRREEISLGGWMVGGGKRRIVNRETFALD